MRDVLGVTLGVVTVLGVVLGVMMMMMTVMLALGVVLRLLLASFRHLAPRVVIVRVRLVLTFVSRSLLVCFQ
jgi:hypothetical protein